MKNQLCLIFFILLSSWMTKPISADLQAYIQKFESLPDLYLSPEETAIVNLDNYFSGFNLTFEGDHVEEKYFVMDTSLLTFNGTELQISKSFSQDQITRIVNFQPSHQITWTDFSSSENYFLDSNYIALPENIVGCRDLAFLSINNVIADCWTNSQSYFIIIDLLSGNVNNITNTFNPKKLKTTLQKSDGYMGSDVIYSSFGEDWFFIVIGLDLSDNSISWHNTYTLDSYEDVSDNFIIDSLIVWDAEILLITSGNQIGFLNETQLIKIMSIGDTDVKFKQFSNLLSFSPGFLYTSVLYNGNEGVYEVILDRFLNIVTVNNYLFPYSSSLYSFAQTESYIGCISADGKKGFYYTIFERGNTDPQVIFYMSQIPGKTFIHNIQSKDFQGFLIARREIQAILVREPALNITNHFPDRETPSVTIKSLDQITKVTYKLEQLNEDDDYIYKLDRQVEVVRNVNTSKFVDLSEIFLGPNLTYFFEFDDKENGYFLDNSIYNLNLSGVSNVTFAKLVADINQIEVFIQTSLSPDVLTRYLCTENKQTDSFDCNLNSSGTIGNVQKMYIHMNYYIIIVENSPTNMSVIVSDKGDDFSTGTVIVEGCRLVYLSSDSILEQTTYCILEDTIKVYAVTKHLYTWNIEQQIDSLVTHYSFPGLVFISRHNEIEVFFTDFFLHDPVKISSLKIYGGFDFLVTQDSLVVFNTDNGIAEEFDIHNPRKIVPRKKYMLFNYELIDNDRAFAYSSISDYLYFIASSGYQSDNTFLLGLQTNSPGNSNLKYKFNLEQIDPYSVILDVDYYMPETDMLLVITGEKSYIQKIMTIPYLVLDPLNIDDSTKLFQTTKFNISAQSLMNTMSTVTVHTTLTNTQRQIVLKDNINVPSLVLQPKGGEANISFKGEDIFIGPTFYLYLDIDYNFDNIDLINRIDSQKIVLDLPVIAAAENGVYVALLSKEGIRLYDFSYFPQKFHLNSTIIYNCEIAEMAIDKSSLIVSCGDDVTNNYLTYIDLYNTSNTCNFSVDFCTEDIYMKVSGNYIYILIPYVFNTLLIYELDSNSCARLVHTINSFELGLKSGKGELSYSIDVYTTKDNQTSYVFITTASSIFKTIIINKGSKPYITAFPKIERLIAPDHFDNEQTSFAGIKLHSISEASAQDLLNFEILVSSLNAFTYLLHCSMTMSGVYQACFPRKGFIQYQGYSYQPILYATSRYFALIGINRKTMRNDVFLYDLQSEAYLPNHIGSYPLYDTFQAMPAPLDGDYPTLLFDKGQYHIMLFYNSNDRQFDEYIIRENFTIYSDASHLSSPTVIVTGKNDFWSADYGVSVINYGALFRGVSSLLIVLIVFFSLAAIFLGFVCINRYFRFKEKRTLKDEMNYAVQDYFKMDKEENAK